MEKLTPMPISLFPYFNFAPTGVNICFLYSFFITLQKINKQINRNLWFLAMKRFFIKYWWAFPILLTVSPLTLILSSHFLYSLDWSAKVPMLILYALIFLLSFIALFVSWIILFKNKQWWKVITSLLASIMTICALLFFLQPWLGIKATIATP